MEYTRSARGGCSSATEAREIFLSIEKLIYGGDGLARTPPDSNGRSLAVFLPFVLSGERVEAEVVPVKGGFGRGKVVRLVEPSPDRVKGDCRYFEQCGGCHYQHLPYEQQLRAKAGILHETLERVAKIKLRDEIQLHSSAPWNYRNRTRLRVRTTPDFALGYFRTGSHDFLAVEECPISSPLINRMLGRLIALRGCECPVSVEELELFVNRSDERLLAWAFCRREADGDCLREWADRVRGEIPEIAGVAFFSSRRREEDETRVDLKLLANSGERALDYQTQGKNYRVSAGAFFQVNRHLIDELITTLTSNESGDAALDLYAGVGLFSAELANSFRHIVAVEASATSYADLVHNSPANMKAVRTRTEDYLRNRPARKRPDLIVIDPPRAGAGRSVIRSLVELGAPRIRYLSCDPATLARDLAPLLEAGYRIEEAHLFDLFPQTYHIESLVLLTR